ncbi:hypothetical protein EON81_27450 [bacterium]|nr:MAG: hypothetical protein EON81_27450 [bacterium]
MNPETIDLSTWRTDAPPADLRSRALRRKRTNPLPRLGLAAMGAVGLGTLLVVATAPVRAEALWRSAAARSGTGLVHYVDEVHLFSDPRTRVSRSEVWLAPGIKRVRISGTLPNMGSSQPGISRPLGVNDMISVTLGHGHQATRARTSALRLVQNAWKRGRISQSFPGAGRKVPIGTFLIRRAGKRFTVEHVSPLDFPTLTSPFDPKTITERFARSGGAKVEEIGGSDRTRVLLVTGNEPWRYRISIDRETGLLIESDSESRDGDVWVRLTHARFDYPTSLPNGLFDPATIRR